MKCLPDSIFIFRGRFRKQRQELCQSIHTFYSASFSFISASFFPGLSAVEAGVMHCGFCGLSSFIRSLPAYNAKRGKLTTHRKQCGDKKWLEFTPLLLLLWLPPPLKHTQQTRRFVSVHVRNPKNVRDILQLRSKIFELKYYQAVHFNSCWTTFFGLVPR